MSLFKKYGKDIFIYMPKFLLISIIMFYGGGFDTENIYVPQKKECRVEIDFVPINVSSNSNINAKLILESSSKGLAFYCEIKNASSGTYQLELTDRFHKNSSSNKKEFEKSINEKILNVIIEQGMNKGRTVIADPKKNCNDVIKLKKQVFLIRKIDEANSNLVLLSKPK